MPPSSQTSRIVEVPPERFTRWVAGFAGRHGEFELRVDAGAFTLVAADGSTAVVDPPFPPLPALPAAGEVPALPAAGGPAAELLDVVATHAMKPRTIGVLLVRLGGYAAGVFDGAELVASKVGSRQVHGRSAAGGWSQQRFARRREGQVRVALDAAVSAAVLVLVPALPRLEAVVTGGDRQALRTVLDDQRLSGVRARVTARVLDVPDPKARVLRDSYRAATAVRITITELPPP